MTLLTIPQAASLLALSKYTIRVWITSGRIGYVRLGRAIRISDAEVTRLIREGTHAAQTTKRK